MCLLNILLYHFRYLMYYFQIIANHNTTYATWNGANAEFHVKITKKHISINDKDKPHASVLICWQLQNIVGKRGKNPVNNAMSWLCFTMTTYQHTPWSCHFGKMYLFKLSKTNQANCVGVNPEIMMLKIKQKYPLHMYAYDNYSNKLKNFTSTASMTEQNQPYCSNLHAALMALTLIYEYNIISWSTSP